jgi:hypothetical protein
VSLREIPHLGKWCVIPVCKTHGRQSNDFDNLLETINRLHAEKERSRASARLARAGSRLKKALMEIFAGRYH